MGSWLSSVFSRWSTLDAKVLILGLDNAGKTTFLYKLKHGRVEQTVPTIGFNVETLTFR